MVKNINKDTLQLKEEADNLYVMWEYQKLLADPNWQEERQRITNIALFYLLNDQDDNKQELNPFYLENIPVNRIDKMEI